MTFPALLLAVHFALGQTPVSPTGAGALLRARALYESAAYEEALSQCSTEWAPWHIVPANQKWYRNYVVGTILIDALKRLKMKFPQPDLSGVVVE